MPFLWTVSWWLSNVIEEILARTWHIEKFIKYKLIPSGSKASKFSQGSFLPEQDYFGYSCLLFSRLTIPHWLHYIFAAVFFSPLPVSAWVRISSLRIYDLGREWQCSYFSSLSQVYQSLCPYCSLLWRGKVSINLIKVSAFSYPVLIFLQTVLS